MPLTKIIRERLRVSEHNMDSDEFIDPRVEEIRVLARRDKRPGHSGLIELARRYARRHPAASAEQCLDFAKSQRRPNDRI